MSESLNRHIVKAENFLSNARLIATLPLATGAVAQAYYAFFWLVRGLLAEKDVFTKSHSGARTMFALHYLRTAEIPVSFGADFALLYDRRQLADYDLDGDFPLDEIVYLIGLSEKLPDFIQKKYA